MAPNSIPLEPLTREAFAPFGDVVETAGTRHYPINRGTIERYHDLANIDLDAEGRAIVSIMECTAASSLPYRVEVIERHPLGSQAFVPLDPIRLIVAVIGPGEDPDPATMRAFVSNGRQGVNYHAGVWHMPLISERPRQQYLIVDRAGPGRNCDELELDDPPLIVEA